MQISTTRPSAEALVSTVTSNPSAWVKACTNNVSMAAEAAELVYGCFRTIAAQQSALAAKVMTLATNGPATMMPPMQATKLSYQSCDLVIHSLIEALETVRQASAEIQRLVRHENDGSI